MSTTARRVLSIVLAIVIGLGLLGVGFVLGRNSLGITGFFPGARYRLGIPGFGFGLGTVFTPALTILFWAVVIGFIVWLVSSLVSSRMASHSPSSTTPPAESALDILQKRYARGEITQAEYDEMRRNLGT